MDQRKQVILAFSISSDDFYDVELASIDFGRSMENYVRDSCIEYTRRHLGSRSLHSKKLNQQIGGVSKLSYDTQGNFVGGYGFGKAKDFKKESGDVL